MKNIRYIGDGYIGIFVFSVNKFPHFSDLKSVYNNVYY